MLFNQFIFIVKLQTVYPLWHLLTSLSSTTAGASSTSQFLSAPDLVKLPVQAWKFAQRLLYLQVVEKNSAFLSYGWPLAVKNKYVFDKGPVSQYNWWK